MSVYGKIWGTTELLLKTPFIELHRLAILPDRRCSLHLHRWKWNLFLVLEGSLTIEVHKADYDLVDSTIIGPGQITTVRPGEKHRFVTGAEAVKAIEVYYPESLSEDIVRMDVGGLVEDMK